MIFNQVWGDEMAIKSIEQRRKIRALEAKRDLLMGQKDKAVKTLAQVRLELKQARK